MEHLLPSRVVLDLRKLPGRTQSKIYSKVLLIRESAVCHHITVTNFIHPTMVRYADKYRARTICTPTTPEFCGGAAYAAATGNVDKATEEQLARKVTLISIDETELLPVVLSLQHSP